MDAFYGTPPRTQVMTLFADLPCLMVKLQCHLPSPLAVPPLPKVVRDAIAALNLRIQIDVRLRAAWIPRNSDPNSLKHCRDTMSTLARQTRAIGTVPEARTLSAHSGDVWWDCQFRIPILNEPDLSSNVICRELATGEEMMACGRVSRSPARCPPAKPQTL